MIGTFAKELIRLIWKAKFRDNLFYYLGSVEHRAQVAVYAIMMSEKYRDLISTGLLYYIKANHMQGVPVPDQEKRAIIIKRNELARNLTMEYKNKHLPSECAILEEWELFH